MRLCEGILGVESDNFAALMQINLNDLLDNLGLKRWVFARPALAHLFHRPVAAFTQLVVDYDRHVGEVGLQTASREIMQTMVREVRIAAGAGFLVGITGDMMTMPGLPRVPAANTVRLLPDGSIKGLMQNE